MTHTHTHTHTHTPGKVAHKFFHSKTEARDLSMLLHTILQVKNNRKNAKREKSTSYFECDLNDRLLTHTDRQTDKHLATWSSRLPAEEL